MRSACLFWLEAGKTPPQSQAGLARPTGGGAGAASTCHPTDDTLSHISTRHHFQGINGELNDLLLERDKARAAKSGSNTASARPGPNVLSHPAPSESSSTRGNKTPLGPRRAPPPPGETSRELEAQRSCGWP